MILLVSTLQPTPKQACNQDFAKGGELEAKNILFGKRLNWVRELSKVVQLNHLI